MSERHVYTIAAVVIFSTSGIVAGVPTSTTKPVDHTSGRARLQRALAATRSLIQRAAEPTAKQLQAVAPQPFVPEDRRTHLGFPFQRDEREYDAARPWSSAYMPIRRWAKPASLKERWPRSTDASDLRECLDDTDPELRSLAVEALATLHDAADLPRISPLLTESAKATPVLGYNWQMNASPVFPATGRAAENPLVLLRSWHSRTVRTYAQQALTLMTRRTFASAEQFDEWWSRNKNATECLWYWEERLHREIDEAAETAAATQPDPEWAALELVRNTTRNAILGELIHSPPEVGAKVLLLETGKTFGEASVRELPLRLPTERLLELLNRHGLWRDVEWSGAEGRANYNRMAERIALSTRGLFQPTDVPSLRAILQREHGELWWSGRAALAIAISRLLPAASPDNLDDPETRDGLLRSFISNNSEVSVRGYIARELVRVGLPENWPFLRDACFAEHEESTIPDLRDSILQEMGEPPLTAAKRNALVDLWMDERFSRLWTQRNYRMGADLYRREAIKAVNAHAGRELITKQDERHLVDTPGWLTNVRERISTLK